ncbi:PREDICTED: kinesin-like protein KIN-7O isoform X2 [Tarenaya hassleriana]|uniref:kinesin-like protein KIN-7O isoform X2 n=1 Tax=Tarenaya hassleriana TaxID=28532 RepID=UPI00053C1022|nr:PREDICTED: kinesin-like protein KIN-7O isoform X2 [Tarenaya hassleriana]
MERIHVSVRARPLSPEDAKTSPWKISDNSIFTPSNPSSSFEFDRIFGEDSKTVEVYEGRTKELVAAAVRGFNGTVFAYGQTSSGKTHTMRGSPNEPGVIPLAVHDLFDIILQDVDREFLLRMSYLEIYNEDINDLLAPEHRKLQIHENLERGIYVAGLREEIVASPDQVLELMEFGEAHRHIGQTNMNLYSSRSHTIFRMIIESREKTQGVDTGNACDAVRVSVLNLVDLAGSERASKTGAEGVRLKEGSHINKSLMTLGTVIKKLSEGVENQGGHVPYRDSKLTRILQPALGGNANTAIICNITLAQIHADETKSSLQFASRALRVTNCARVNEILTDAALLKRQKKEIEELRSKLQASQCEHLEEEILNLRNTLLKTELERERIALELEEEKKAQVQREKVLKEQAKKIENLSSMVLLSNRDEKRERDHFKGKRRDTWCLGKLPRDSPTKVDPNILPRGSSLKSERPERGTCTLLPFDELVNENEPEDKPGNQDEGSVGKVSEDCALPDPCNLVHVTSRKKLSVKHKSPTITSVDQIELDKIQKEYEDLLMKYETERTINEVQIECLKRKLDEACLSHETKCSVQSECQVNGLMLPGENIVSLRDSEAILIIKQLQEKLEMEKASSQQNLDDLVRIATEQNICAKEKLIELQEEILVAKEEARVAREQLMSKESEVAIDNFNFVIKLSTEVEALMSEFQTSRASVENISSVVDEVLQDFATFSHEFTSLMHQRSVQKASVVSSCENIQSSLKHKISELEEEKLHLQNQCAGLQNQIEKLSQDSQNHEASLMILSEQHESERSDFLSHIESLEKEMASLSSSSLAKEKENLRKEFEKTKTKLKDTESKLRNAMQDKTKLEGEKASVERELKRLHSQKALLERDINKQESLAGKRRDSLVVERSSKQLLQEDYRKLEVLAFEMETTIASLEEELSVARSEKEEALCRNEGLTSEIAALTKELEHSNSQLEIVQKEVSELKIKLEESSSDKQKLEAKVKLLLEEKEELAMRLAHSLLEMEEEKAIWTSKEKASIETMEEKIRLYNAEILSLSEEMSEAKKELESCRGECTILADRLRCFEENAKKEKDHSMEKSVEIDRLKHELQSANAESKQSQEVLKADLDTLNLELQRTRKRLNMLQKELDCVTSKRDSLLARIVELSRPNQLQTVEAKDSSEDLAQRLSNLEAKMYKEEAGNNIMKAKLKMRLRGTQARLEAINLRYKQSVADSELMNSKFHEASAILKEKLASKALEVIDLKKQLASSSRNH